MHDTDLLTLPDDIALHALHGGPPAPMHCRDWPSHDMPRERLLEAGPGALSDTELIVLMLGSGLPGHNVFDVARALLARFGSLRAMLDATPADFDGLRGIGPARTAQLLAIVEMARRGLAEKMRERPLIDSPGAVEDYLRLLVGARPYEVFVCLFMDARHRLDPLRGKFARHAHAHGGLSAGNCAAGAHFECSKPDRGA